MLTSRTFSTSSKVLQKLATSGEEHGVGRLLATNYSVKSTRLPNGLLVVSLDNNKPLSRVTAIFKAGCRYETPKNEGIVHQIRNNLGLPSMNYSSTTICHETAAFGGIVECSTSRDFLAYNVQSSRDNIFGALESSLTELLCSPKFRFYDLEDTHERMHIDHATIRDDYSSYVIELLHKAAFRNGPLSRSLYAPNRMIGKHTVNMLYDFFDSLVTSNNGALVGLGLDHEHLLAYASELFKLPQGQAQSGAGQSKYGGGEIRKERGGELAVVALAVDGVSLADQKAQIVQSLLSNALGSGPRIKWSHCGENRISRAIKSAVQSPFYVSSINLNYSDGGLFGVHFICQAEDSGRVAKQVIDEFRKAAREGVTDQELQAAKAKVKLQILDAADNDATALLEDLAVQSLTRGSYVSNAELLQLVDGVTASDVNQMAKKVFASKLSIAAIGNLNHLPYLDELSKL